MGIRVIVCTTVLKFSAELVIAVGIKEVTMAEVPPDELSEEVVEDGSIVDDGSRVIFSPVGKTAYCGSTLLINRYPDVRNSEDRRDTRYLKEVNIKP